MDTQATPWHTGQWFTSAWNHDPEVATYRFQPEVEIHDVTLRDGEQQAGVEFTAADKLRIARMLDEFGMPYIEGGWPGSNPKDVEFFRLARDVRWQRAKLAAFGSTRHPANRPEDAPNLPELPAAERPGGTTACPCFASTAMASSSTTMVRSRR